MTHLTFNEGENWKVWDHSGNGNHGDVVGAEWSTDVPQGESSEEETSFTENVISTSADGAHSVHAADVDGDGDMDVL